VRVFFQLIVLNLVDFSLCEGSDEICFLQTGLILFLWCITLAWLCLSELIWTLSFQHSWGLSLR